MEAIRKQASKLREQVAKQQQALLKQLGHFGPEINLVDEAELQCHQQLQSLYNSTRAAKHFQRNIVHGIGGFAAISSKQIEIVRRLAEDCCRYANDDLNSNSSLARFSLSFGTSHNSMEKERDTLLFTLTEQVSEPLRSQIKGAPLEDARHLTHHYQKLRQDVESQVAEVWRRQSKFRDSPISSESSMRLQMAETRLTELKSMITALGKEAIAAMLAVEDEQQQVTFHRLLTMVKAERSYHENALDILERLNDEMIITSQSIGYSSESSTVRENTCNEPGHGDIKLKESDADDNTNNNRTYVMAKVIHPFDAEVDGELSLTVDDFIVLLQVGSNGWSEGECNGKVGWFPSAYVQLLQEGTEVNV